MEGMLSKWTNIVKGWQYRWFVLDDRTGILSYYTSKENMSKGERRGCINLRSAHVGYDDEDDVTFTIKIDDKTFHLQAQNLDERGKWVSKIEETIELHSNDQSNTFYKDSVSLTHQDMQQFDNSLSESDAYLQLLIDQLKLLEEKRNKLATNNEHELNNINALILSTQNFINTIKNAIVCLQIAKVNRDPDNGLHTAADLRQILNNLHTNKALTNTLAKLEKVKVTSQENTNKFMSTISNVSITEEQRTTDLQSYSSDDESFYDAIDEQQQQNTKNSIHEISSSINILQSETKICENNNEEIKSIEAVLITNNTLSPSTPTTTETPSNELKTSESKLNAQQQSVLSTPQSSKIEYDDNLYDNENDQEEEIKAENSVVKHLLSQVKIGMDLSKITLPTFILERRSLLEMYADFFAHPDLFVQIPDIENPRDRMIQVVKWYLSAFHAGRKSPVAKKPYNPILGEIFQCHYTLPDEPVDNTVVSDGPVPWSTRSQVAFIAEQVSHHPPISAFYAESYNKRIQLDGYIWTKSKFLGLSIGVHMVGKAVVSLLDRDEEYVLTFPSAYGRGILTVPWFEMGGKVTISCAKTRYSADIEFVTKSFYSYSTKKNQVIGSIYTPDKKVLYTIDGEWNGIVYAKPTFGKKVPEVFINVNEMKTIKKQVRQIVEQNDYESRRLWHEVTYFLKHKQIDNATLAKQKLEQKQRDEAKYHKENNLKWKTRYFTEQGENWIFVKPLIQRLQETPQPQQPLTPPPPPPPPPTTTTTTTTSNQ